MGLVLLYLLVTLAGLGGRAVAARALDLGDDESWALGRTLGLVAVAYPAWWAGVAGLASWRWLGAAVLVVLGLAGAFDWWRRRPDWRAVARVEAVFLAAAAGVVWIRLERPAILHQEKLMDLGIFASLLRAEAFPPPDMWLAGEGLPYYYWGALIWTVPLTLSRVPLDLSYNLVVAAVGGLAACLLWVLGRRAHPGRWAGAMAVLVGLFAGTPDGLRQLFAGKPLLGLDLWHSSRQVPDTITEWPLFTLWLGDLHPHLLSVPLALAAMLVAWEIGRRGAELRLVAAATVLFGVTWAANPWAMPPTLAAVALLALCGGGRWHWPGRQGWPRWAAVAVIAVGGWLAGMPFHLHFHPPFQGVRAVFAWTPPLELLLWGGVVLLPVAAATWVLGTAMLGGGDALRARAAALSVLAVTLVLAAASGRPTLVVLVLVLATLVLAVLIGGAADRDRPAVALAALGVFLLLVPELVYVVDSYGDKLHRMNTVFKSYAQAWVLLAIAFPALAALGFRGRAARAAAVVVIVVSALPHLLGLAALPLTGRPLGLDGLAWLDPGDRAVVRHLRTQPPGTTIVEAVGGAYTEYARISSASGVPALLGWANHAMVWLGHEISEETERRRRLVEVIYRSGDPGVVARAVAEAGVDLVVIGALERRDFEPASLQAIRTAGEVVLSEEGAELVRFDGTGR
ncbi:MAG TPA: DUF2298 domain-containing protein [Candidatus Sulfomarinibacteraceae bacterium]|nr:DUF2298 domain-containing protein [Candidatus Sulfomarinibacteraceae bacterium]